MDFAKLTQLFHGKPRVEQLSDGHPMSIPTFESLFQRRARLTAVRREDNAAGQNVATIPGATNCIGLDRGAGAVRNVAYFVLVMATFPS